MNKSWGNCSYWIYCSFYILWGTFHFKTNSKYSSPASLGITISPINGILEINLFMFSLELKFLLNLYDFYFDNPPLRRNAWSMASISSNFKISSCFIILISKISKDKPSPAARSLNLLNQLKTAILLHLELLQFKIFNFKFEIELFLSIIVVNNNLPPIKLLKNLYSDNRGLGRSE